MTVLDETTLVLTRIFDASPERVFDAWLVREQFESWIGPEGIPCTVPVFEPRVAGRYRIDMKLSDGTMLPVSGVFRTVDRPRTLSFTWGWHNDPDRQSLLTLTFREHGEGTELTLVQEGLGSVVSRDDHGQGWSGALNKLGRFLDQGV